MLRTVTRGLLRTAGHVYPFHRTARMVHNSFSCWATAPLTEPVAIHCRSGVTIFAKPSDLIGRQLYLTGTWDPHLLLVLRALCTAGTRTIVDVGANLGYFSLSLAMTAPQAAVHAVEPQPALAEQIRQSIAETGLSRVSVHNFALSSADGEATLVLNPKNLGGSGIDAAHGDDRPTIRIPIRSGGPFLDSLGVEQIDLMKVDVEGHEAQVFTGIEPWLASQRVRAIVFEVRALGDDLGAAAIVQRYGYVLLGVEKGLVGPVIRPWSPGQHLPEDFVALRPRDAEALRVRLARWIVADKA